MSENEKKNLENPLLLQPFFGIPKGRSNRAMQVLYALSAISLPLYVITLFPVDSKIGKIATSIFKPLNSSPWLLRSGVNLFISSLPFVLAGLFVLSNLRIICTDKAWENKWNSSLYSKTNDILYWLGAGLACVALFWRLRNFVSGDKQIFNFVGSPCTADLLLLCLSSAILMAAFSMSLLSTIEPNLTRPRSYRDNSPLKEENHWLLRPFFGVPKKSNNKVLQVFYAVSAAVLPFYALTLFSPESQIGKFATNLFKPLSPLAPGINIALAAVPYVITVLFLLSTLRIACIKEARDGKLGATAYSKVNDSLYYLGAGTVIGSLSLKLYTAISGHTPAFTMFNQPFTVEAFVLSVASAILLGALLMSLFSTIVPNLTRPSSYSQSADKNNLSQPKTAINAYPQVVYYEQSNHLEQ